MYELLAVTCIFGKIPIKAAALVVSKPIICSCTVFALPQIVVSQAIPFYVAYSDSR